jgi:NTE family protein
MPIRPLENRCSRIIGSFVNPVGYEETVVSLTQIAERVFMLNMSKEVLEKKERFDLFIAPQELKNYKILDPEKAVEVFDLGYTAPIEKLRDPVIRQIFGI